MTGPVPYGKYLTKQQLIEKNRIILPVMKPNRKRQLSLFLIGITGLWAVPPSPCAEWGDPCLDDHNMYTLHITARHDDAHCPLHKTAHHYWKAVGGKFTFPNDKDWGCDLAIHCFVNILGQESGTLELPLHDCFGFDSDIAFDLSEYSLKLNIVPTQDFTSIQTVPQNDPTEEAWQYEYFDPSQPIITVPVLQLLSKGYRTRYGCSELEIRLSPSCDFQIQNTSIAYIGHPYRYEIQADIANHDLDKGIEYNPACFRWEYRHSGLEDFEPLPMDGKQIGISPASIPDMPLGENILIKLSDGKSSHASNTKALFFYPNIPQPILTGTQTIGENEAALRKLTLSFDRQLRTDLDERLRLITIYDTLATGTGNNPVSEARVLFQQAVDITRLPANLKYTLDIPLIYHIDEGTYYVSVEGTARGKSNNPEAGSNKNLAADIKTAMFRMVPFEVDRSQVDILDIEYTPPLCHDGKGSVRVTLGESFLVSTKPYPSFYYTKADGSLEEIDFTCESPGSIGLAKSIFRCDNIGPDMNHFKIKLSTMSMSGTATVEWGAFNLDPEHPAPMRFPIYCQHISGYYYEDGTRKSAQNGWIRVERSRIQNGKPPYTFTYRILSTNPLIEYEMTDDLIPVATAANYQIRATDANGCHVDTNLMVLHLSNQIQTELQIENPISCHNAQDGSLRADIIHSGSGNLSFEWYKDGQLIPLAGGPLLNNLGPGTYQVKMTDREYAMTATASLTLSQPPALDLTVHSILPVYCKGLSTGYIGLDGNGGTPPYIYSWSDGAFGNIRSDLPAGEYTLKLIDNNGCLAERTFSINEPRSRFEIVVDSISHVHYGQDGQLILGRIFTHGSGGILPYGQIYCHGETSLDNLQAGKYTLVQWDAMHCQDSKEIEIKSHSPLQIRTRLWDSIRCHGEHSATCQARVDGGVPPYTIRWSTGDTTPWLHNMPAGEYIATVTDAYGIIQKDTLTVTQPSPLQAEISEIQHPPHQGCFADSCPLAIPEGILQIKVSGGRPPYQVNWIRNGKEWKKDQDLFKQNGLPEGHYQIHVTDQNQCHTCIEDTLFQVPMLKASILLEQSIGCSGENSGILLSSVSGGVPPFRFQWFKADSSLAQARHLESVSSGTELLDTASFVENLYAGLYFLRVTDAKGVRSWAKRTLAQPTPIELSFTMILPPSYPGSQNGVIPERPQDGEVEVSIKGGTPPYHLTWKKAGLDTILASTARITGLDSGWYTLTVADHNLCQADTSVYLPETAPLVTHIRIQDSISCHGSSDGSLALDIQGGTPPYRIQWFQEDQSLPDTGQSLRNLHSSSYKAEVTDALGVQSSFRRFLPQPDSLQSRIESRASLCHGDSSGHAFAHAEGGTAPYTYIWHLDGKPLSENSANLSGIEEGRIELKIIDSRSCQSQSQTEIKAPDTLALHASLSHPSYTGSLFGIPPAPPSDGKIELSVSGGIPPYQISWGHGDTSLSLQNLDTGFYHVQIRDANGCTAEQGFRLERATSLSTRLHVLSQPLCAGDSTGSFRLDLAGGVPPYRYDWEVDGKWFSQDSTTVMHGMPAGTYTVKVQDSRGIYSMDSLRINEPERLQAEAEIQHASSWDTRNGSIRLDVHGGTPPYHFQWNTGNTEASLSEIGRGTYRVRVSDANRCVIEKEYRIQSPDSLHISSYSIGQDDITIHVEGGMKPYQYQWEDFQGKVLQKGVSDSNNLSLHGLPVGIYRFQLRDAGKAEISLIFEIRIIRDLESTIMLKQPVHCHGDSSAVLQAFIQGGTEPWRWRWEKYDPDAMSFIPIASESLILDFLPAGIYRFQAWDADGSTASDSLEISQPDPLRIETEILRPENLPDTADGLFASIGYGGSLPYHFLWNTGNTESRQYFRTDRSYTVQLTDAKGCQVQQHLDTLVSSQLQTNIHLVAGIACHGEATGILKAEILHGKKPLHIRWSTGDTIAKLSGLPAGLYTVKVSDAWGKTDSASYLLREPEALQNLIETSIPSCHGADNGQIRIQTTGGNGGIQYLWNTGSQAGSLFNLKEGSYVLVTYDRLGCRRTDTVLMEAPPLLRLPVEILPVDCPDGSGRIVWKAQGGTPPYSYHWENLSWQEGMRGLGQGSSWLIDPAAAGRYLLEVADSLQCTADTSLELPAPEPPSYSIERQRTLCAGQILSLAVNGSDTLDGMEYLWFFPDGRTSNQANIQADQAGTYQLRLIQNQNCIYRDSVVVTASLDSIHAEFWVSSQITEGQNVLLVDLSRHKPDSSRWILPKEASILMQEGKYLEILFPNPGHYSIGLTVFKGNCSESYFRNVQVDKETRKIPSGTNPKATACWRAVPNPFREEFSLYGRCNMETNVRYHVLSALSGKRIQSGQFHLPADTEVRIPLSVAETPAGTYILLLEYNNERSIIKIIKNQ